MKKNFLALAALASIAFSGAAMAEVTVFGTIDAAVTGSNSDAKGTVFSLENGGNTANRIGFRGTEDLGGGLKAGFWLEAGFNENGGNGLSFNRRSTVSLSGNEWGEVRLGRDFTPTYLAYSAYDVWGNTGPANYSSNLAFNLNRTDNQLTYITPNFSGFSAQLTHSFAEGGRGSDDAGRYTGAMASYKNGQFQGSVGYGEQRIGKAVFGEAADLKIGVIGASYDLGVAKLNGAYTHTKLTSDFREKALTLGVEAPVTAQGVLKASFSHYDTKVADVNLDRDLYAVGYVHSLSKRTSVYGTLSFLKDKNNIGARDDVTTYQVGLKHSF